MRARRTLAVAVIAVTPLVACSSDDTAPQETVPEDVPVFDPAVPDGVETETDEGRNQGFEVDEPSGNGAVLDPPD